jgi:acetolactate synthase-1/2/3 large subunit
MRIDKPEQVQDALQKALASKGPFLLDCIVEPEENVWPMVPAGAPIHEMIGELA